MGLDNFWLSAAAAATIAFTAPPAFHLGTQPAGYHRDAGSRESAHVRPFTGFGPVQVWPELTVLDATGDRTPLLHPFDLSVGTVVPEVPSAEVVALDAAVPILATHQAQVLEDIRKLTGLSWPQIAKLVGVKRQTVFRWRNGRPADEDLAKRATEVLDILVDARQQHGEVHDLRRWLNRRAPLQAASPFELIAQNRLDEARFLAMLAPSKVILISDQARDTSQWDRFIAQEERSYPD